MVWFRKWMILIHRYLGIALSLVFIVWFVSGIAMMYARDMPGLTPQERLKRLPPLNLERVWITPAQAAEGASLGLTPGRATLLTVMDRPAYRFAGRDGTSTIFAETGEKLVELGEAGIINVATSFMNLPREAMRHAGVLTEPDQWTIAQRGQMPLHKIVVNDAARTQLYISPKLGEVLVLTTRGTRALAWVAAIPHWFYFAPLRLNGVVWRGVVLWTAGLGSLLALIGIVLGIIQFSPKRPYIPYSGWMRWHYITGVVFGILTFTWVFSGMLSLQPWDWASGGDDIAEGIPQALSGGTPDLADYKEMNAEEWKTALEGRAVKEVAFVRVQGDPYYLVRGVEEKPLLLTPKGAASENLFDTTEQPLAIKREPFSVESLMRRVKEVHPDLPVAESELLSQYDSYYYSNEGARPLPVLRIKFSDPENTWLYIDPHLSQITGLYTRLGRVERWIYHGFHSLDFSFWYYNRPIWDIAVIVLSIGCIISSGLGFFVGLKRVLRYLRRTVAHGLFP